MSGLWKMLWKREREREMERNSPEENWNLKCLTSFTSALQQPRPNTPNTPNTPNSPLHLSGTEKAMAVQHLIMPPIRVQSWHGPHGPRGPKQGPKHGPSQRLQGLAERIGPLPAVFCGHHFQCHLLTLQYLATRSRTKGLIPESGLNTGGSMGVPHQTLAQF